MVVLSDGFLSGVLLLQKVQVLFVSLSLGPKGVLAERGLTWKGKKGCKGKEQILGPTQRSQAARGVLEAKQSLALHHRSHKSFEELVLIF